MNHFENIIITLLIYEKVTKDGKIPFILAFHALNTRIHMWMLLKKFQTFIELRCISITLAFFKAKDLQIHLIHGLISRKLQTSRLRHYDWT